MLVQFHTAGKSAFASGQYVVHIAGQSPFTYMEWVARKLQKARSYQERAVPGHNKRVYMSVVVSGHSCRKQVEQDKFTYGQCVLHADRCRKQSLGSCDVLWASLRNCGKLVTYIQTLCPAQLVRKTRFTYRDVCCACGCGKHLYGHAILLIMP
jgi:hypothetical protein